MKGDVWFYRSSGTWEDRLIAWWTHGVYVHCEVDMGDGTSVGAYSPVVIRHPVMPGGDVAATGARCDPSKLDAALAWLASQVGDPYGWTDIAGDAAKPFLPRLPWPAARKAYDCSHLALATLLRAGFPAPAAVAADPATVSPNDLARALGLEK